LLRSLFTAVAQRSPVKQVRWKGSALAGEHVSME